MPLHTRAAANLGLLGAHLHAHTHTVPNQ
jgi:hypothetical protein